MDDEWEKSARMNLASARAKHDQDLESLVSLIASLDLDGQNAFFGRANAIRDGLLGSIGSGRISMDLNDAEIENLALCFHIGYHIAGAMAAEKLLDSQED
jgi:hypothetical protein